MNDALIVSETDAAILGMMPLTDPLKRELGRARIVPPEEVPPDVATMNSLVRYTDETAGITRTVALVYPRAARRIGMVSVLAPVGSALLGLSAGQSIEWEFPGGSSRKLRLDEVLHQPQRARRKAARKAGSA